MNLAKAYLEARIIQSLTHRCHRYLKPFLQVTFSHACQGEQNILIVKYLFLALHPLLLVKGIGR